VNRWNGLDQATVDVGSINSFKGRFDKIRKTRMGFLWILHGPESPRPHGDGNPVRPHKVSKCRIITIVSYKQMRTWSYVEGRRHCRRRRLRGK